MAKKTDIPILGVDMRLDVFALVRLRLEQIPSTLLSGNMGYTEYESVYSCFLALVFPRHPPRLTHEDSHEKKPRITKQEFFPELATVDTAVSQTVKQRRKVPIAS